MIFTNCSKSRSNTRNGSASFIRIQRDQERLILSSYEDLTTILPEEYTSEDSIPNDRARSFRRSFDMQTAVKVALPDRILHRFRPRSIPRDPWLVKKRLREDLAHLEPLDEAHQERSLVRLSIYVSLHPSHRNSSSSISFMHNHLHCCSTPREGRDNHQGKRRRLRHHEHWPSGRCPRAGTGTGAAPISITTDGGIFITITTAPPSPSTPPCLPPSPA